MEKIPNEILLKIFSYLEIQDLGRCAKVSKKFHEIAYEKVLWQKLAVNLAGKRVPVEFLQHIMKHGIAYLNLDYVEIHGHPGHFLQQNSLKYLILGGSNAFLSQRIVKNDLMASCTQLEKLSCTYISENELDDVLKCIVQNGKSLKCLKISVTERIEFFDKRATRFSTAISSCKKLDKLWINFGIKYNILDLMKNLPQDLKKLCFGWLDIREIKVLVVTCSKLEDLFLNISCCDRSKCHHFEQVISIIAESSLSDTLVNLSLRMKWNKEVRSNEKFVAKCLKLGQMRKLKKIEIIGFQVLHLEIPIFETEKDALRKKLPDLTIVENRRQEDFLIPADPYAKHDSKSGFWEISCNQPSMSLKM